MKKNEMVFKLNLLKHQLTNFATSAVESTQNQYLIFFANDNNKNNNIKKQIQFK